MVNSIRAFLPWAFGLFSLFFVLSSLINPAALIVVLKPGHPNKELSTKFLSTKAQRPNTIFETCLTPGLVNGNDELTARR